MSGGRIKISIYYGGVLGSAAEQLNMCETGAVDMTLVGIGHYAGRFPLTEIFTTPGLLYENSYQVAQALEWEFNNSQYSYLQDEISSVKVLGFRTNTRNPFSHSGKPWESPSELHGKRINSSNGPANAMSAALGMDVVTVAFPDRYEAMSKNMIDACTSDYLALEAFGMYEVIDSVCDISFSCQVNYITMNWDSWNSLPSDLQDILMEASSTLKEEFYEIMKDVENTAQTLAAEHDVTIYQPNDEVRVFIEEAMRAGAQSWIDERTAQGYDAQGLFDEIQSTLDSFAP